MTEDKDREIPMRLLRNALVSSTVVAALMAFAAPVAVAQEQPALPSEALSEQQITAFVDAALEVQRVRSEFDSQVQAAESPEDIERLRQEAQEQATEAIENSGLTPGEYSTIVDAANQDPQLYAMIVDLMQQRRVE
jgi:hypothetical protein